MMDSYFVCASMHLLSCHRTTFTLATLESCLLSQVIHINLYCFLLQDNAISKRMLQLVGVTAMFIASKYEELFPPRVGDFAYLTDYTYTSTQICQMEMKILRALDFGLGRPLPPHFLRRTSKIAEVVLRTGATVSSI